VFGSVLKLNKVITDSLVNLFVVFENFTRLTKLNCCLSQLLSNDCILFGHFQHPIHIFA
jgi:hypothetical protein